MSYGALISVLVAGFLISVTVIAMEEKPEDQTRKLPVELRVSIVENNGLSLKDFTSLSRVNKSWNAVMRPLFEKQYKERIEQKLITYSGLEVMTNNDGYIIKIEQNSWTTIPLDAVKLMGKLKYVREINLTNARVGKIELDYLKDLRALEKLYLLFTKTPKENKDAFLKYRRQHGLKEVKIVE